MLNILIGLIEQKKEEIIGTSQNLKLPHRLLGNKPN
jgi:hypothetical protein